MDRHVSNNEERVKDGLIPGTDKGPEIVEVDEAPMSTFCSQRWILAYIGLLFGVIVCIYRANMSIAIVCMVRPVPRVNNTDLFTLVTLNDTFDNSTDVNTATGDQPGVCREEAAKASIVRQGEFDWDKGIQSHILSAYFYGYLVSQIPGGWLSNKYGGKHVVSICMALSALFTLLTPVLARANPYAVVMARAMIGILARRGEFDWDKETQSHILSAYFYGFLVSQIPGGWLSTRYGGKHVVSVGMAFGALFTLLTPVLARTHPYAVVMARAMIGLLAGFTMPAFFALVSVWALPNERSRFLALTWFGQNIGMMIGYVSSGELCATGFDRGWGSIFYVHGIIGTLFMVVWLYFIASTPQSHPRITDAEKKLLEKMNNYREKAKKKKPQVPWLKVVTTASSWAVMITHTFDNFTYYLIVTCLPLYLKDVLKFDIQSNGLYSSLPFLSILVGLATSGTLADFLISKRIFSRTVSRKILQLTGMAGEVTFIIAASYMKCDQKDLVIACLCLCTFFESFGMAAGFPCNIVDMAPSYAPVLFGVSNCIATVPGLAAPLVVAKLTPNGTTEEWRLVFFIAAGLVVCAALIYGLFSTSELAPWAEERTSLNHEIVINENENENQTEMDVLNGGLKT